MHDNAHAALIQKTLGRVRALAQSRTRRSEGRFFIEGVRNFIQACDAKLAVETIVHCPVLLKSPFAEKLVRKLAAAGVPRVRVTPEQFRSISTTTRASGIGAIVRQSWLPLDDADSAHGLCWLVMETIRSPGNLGSILRTAEACSVGGIIFIGPECDPFDPAVLRAGMGGTCHLPMVRASLAQLESWLRRHGVELVGLSPEASQLWTEAPVNRPTALVLGEEREGLSAGLRQLCTTLVRLPMPGRADSLNVSVAAGVMLYELIRRQTTSGVA